MVTEQEKNEELFWLACVNGDKAVLKKILSDYYFDAHFSDDEALKSACRAGRLDIVDFIMSSDDFRRNVSELDLCRVGFFEACAGAKKDVMVFFAKRVCQNGRQVVLSEEDLENAFSTILGSQFSETKEKRECFSFLILEMGLKKTALVAETMDFFEDQLDYLDGLFSIKKNYDGLVSKLDSRGVDSPMKNKL